MLFGVKKDGRYALQNFMFKPDDIDEDKIVITSVYDSTTDSGETVVFALDTSHFYYGDMGEVIERKQTLTLEKLKEMHSDMVTKYNRILGEPKVLVIQNKTVGVPRTTIKNP